MSEAPEQGSKTEPASAKKKQDALEKGQIPVAREVPVFASVAAISVLVAFVLAGPAGDLATRLGEVMGHPSNWDLRNGRDAASLLYAVALTAGGVVAPAVMVLLGFSLAASFAQNQPRLVKSRIEPKLSKISPIAGARRLFGLAGQVEFAKALAKFTIIGVMAAVLLGSETALVMRAMLTDPVMIPDTVAAIALRLLGGILAALAVLAVADLVWSRIKWERDLRMTRQEVKDEQKQAEGDPMMKARRLSLARDRSRRRMISAVRTAAIVVVNPTHYAVALRYGAGDGGAPVMVAKGRDLVALRIRETAEENDVPVVRDPPLARALHDSVPIDTMIPPEFYQAVAELLCFFSMRRVVR